MAQQVINENKSHYIEDDIKTILNVRIFIEPDRVDEWISKSSDLFQKVMAEPACRYFVVGQVNDNPGELWWTEGWSESVEWLMENQVKKEYYKPYYEATESMFIKPREFELLSPIKPKFSAFKMPKATR